MKKLISLCLAVVMSAALATTAFAATTTPPWQPESDMHPDTDATAVDTATDDFANFTDVTPSDTDNSHGASSDLTLLINAKNISATVPLKLAVLADADGGSLKCPSNYSIKNYSSFPIYVTKVEFTQNNTTTFTLDETGTDKNAIKLAMTGAGDFTSKSVLNSTSYSPKGWSIAGDTGSSGVASSITFSGTNGKLSNVTDIESFVTIKYTVSTVDNK